MTARKDFFVRCAVDCSQCQREIVSFKTALDRIPRRLLRNQARQTGAVKDRGGNWFCNEGCRTKFRLTHNTRVEDDTKITPSDDISGIL